VAFPVYSTLLQHGNYLGTSDNLSTVPEGYVWVVRDIDVFYDAEEGAAVWECDLCTPDSIAYCLPLYVNNPAAEGSWSWRGRQVLPSGYQLRVLTTLGRWYWGISGYQLTLP
jgi:hypothetical protein